MAGYYDEITGDWVDTGGDGYEQLDDSSGTNEMHDAAIWDPGSESYTDWQGYPVDSTGVPMPGNPSYTEVADPAVSGSDAESWVSKITSLTGADLKKWIAENPKLASSIAGVGAKALGLTDIKNGGWQGSIPQLEAVRSQIHYNDANREPGSTGRQYFTPTQYVAPGLAGAAQTAANTQAQGIAAATPTASPQANPYAGKFAMPWATQNAAGPTGGLASSAPDQLPDLNAAQANLERTIAMNREQPQQLAKGGIAQGRYLQGSTDGMADEIDTSIDNKQPAKLSHGEFVIPADVVSHLGNGNSEAGAKHLYAMMDKVREARTGTKKQGKEINPDKFTPGGLAAHHNYAGGGAVAFADGGVTSNVSGYGGTASSTLSPWAGDYVSGMLGKGQALANSPYQAYQGPLTAGASDLQQQQQAGLSQLAQTGLAPTQYSTGSFDSSQASKYMNPYLQASLDPQLKELQRVAQINNAQDAARMIGAGSFGGGRQAVLMGEQNRNLLDKSGALLSQGYSTAYDKAMNQFNTEQGRGLDVQKAQDQSNQASANFGLNTLNALGTAGATQRDITQQGLTADKAAFEAERDNPYKMVQYQQGLLQGLPLTTNTVTPNQTALSTLNPTISDMTTLLKSLGVIPAT